MADVDMGVMKRIVIASAGVVLSAILAHWLIYGASQMDVKSSAWSYRGTSQQAGLVVNQLWSRARGLSSEKDCLAAVQSLREAVCDARGSIAEFGHFYSLTEKLLCPALGFAFFIMLARRKIDRQLWKPIVIVTVAVAVPSSPTWEIARAALVAAGMIASVEMALIFGPQPLNRQDLSTHPIAS